MRRSPLFKRPALLLCVFAFLVLLAGEFSHANDVALVVPADFVPAMKPWIDYRARQGYRVHVIEDHNLEEDAASPRQLLSSTAARIRTKIRTLHEKVGLESLLIVGRAACENPQTPTISAPLLPTLLIQHFGEETDRACDDWYADMDGDGEPDFPVGRWPVENAAQISDVFQKIIRYETVIPRGYSHRRIQIVAGMGNFTPLIDYAIDLAARAILKQTLPDSWQIALLRINWQSPFCPEPFSFQDEIAETLNRAPLFWVYLGHGRARELQPLITPQGYVPTLCADDLPTLTCSENLPIALLFCCYAGMLDHPTKSLAEELFLEQEGPVAVVAASRTTMPFGMSVLGVELLQEYLQTERADKAPLTLGEWFFVAKQRMRQQNGHEREPLAAHSDLRKQLETLARFLDPMPKELDVQLTEQASLFHLFGDPLLKMPVLETLRLDCAKTVTAGDMLPLSIAQASGSSLSIAALPIEGGTLRLEWTMPMEKISLKSTQRQEFSLETEVRQVWNREYVYSNQTVVQELELPWPPAEPLVLPVPGNIQGEYVLRVALCSERQMAVGSCRIMVRRK